MSLIRGRKIGSGSYGSIYSFKKDGKEYAVKRNIIDVEIDFAGSLLELDILRTSYHPYVLRLESYSFGNPFTRPGSPIKIDYQKEDALHFVFEKAHCSLYDLIEKNTIPEKNIPSVMMQILLSLEYLHHRKIIHRDVKPDNYLYFEFTEPDPNSGLNYAIKLCDFGLSRRHTTVGSITPGLFTVIYRPPESCLGATYDYRADIWGAGVIFYELLFPPPSTGIFELKGEENSILLSQIVRNVPILPSWQTIERLGKDTHSISLTGNSRVRKAYSLRMTKLGGVASVPMPADPVIYDLLTKLLTFDPEGRISAREALEHPYFSSCAPVIEKLRSVYLVAEVEKSNSILNDTSRNIMVSTLSPRLHEYRKGDNRRLYPLRLFFHAISLYDRYQEIKTHPNFDVENVANVCFYISLKYFTTMLTPPSYRYVIKNKAINERSIAEIEKYIIEKVCDLSIYATTPYEILENTATESEILTLYNYYSNSIPTGVYTSTEIVELCRTSSSIN